MSISRVSSRRHSRTHESDVVESKAQFRSVPKREILLLEGFDTLRTALRYGTFAYLAYCGWQSIDALAGKTTGADLALAVNAAIQVGREEWPPWVIAILMAVWAVIERRFRRRSTTMLTARIADLERRFEPARKRPSIVGQRQNTGG